MVCYGRKENFDFMMVMRCLVGYGLGLSRFVSVVKCCNLIIRYIVFFCFSFSLFGCVLSFGIFFDVIDRFKL